MTEKGKHFGILPSAPLHSFIFCHQWYSKEWTLDAAHHQRALEMLFSFALESIGRKRKRKYKSRVVCSLGKTTFSPSGESSLCIRECEYTWFHPGDEVHSSNQHWSVLHILKTAGKSTEASWFMEVQLSCYFHSGFRSFGCFFWLFASAFLRSRSFLNNPETSGGE